MVDVERKAPRLSVVAPGVISLPEQQPGDVAPPEVSPAEVARAALLPAEVLMERLRAAQDRSAAQRDRRAAARDLARATTYLRVAHEDELTGVMQRWPGMVALSRAVNLAHLHKQAFSVAFLDVDGLKRANDTRGHAAGDMMLRAVGHALRAALRSEDIALRYGGDEFVCALPGVGMATARRRIVEVHESLSAAAPAVSISVGLAQLRRDESSEAVVQRADQDMYRARSLRRTGDHSR